jgi:hypothetical protein
MKIEELFCSSVLPFSTATHRILILPNLSLSQLSHHFGSAGMSVQEKKKIRETLRIFFLAQETADEKLFLKVWHPDARRFVYGSNNELYIFGTEDIFTNQFTGIRQAKKANPGFSVTFLITRIKQNDIDKDNLISSATVEWQMLSMGQCIGVHYTYFQFVKIDGEWVITNVTDRGKEM